MDFFGDTNTTPLYSEYNRPTTPTPPPIPIRHPHHRAHHNWILNNGVPATPNTSTNYLPDDDDAELIPKPLFSTKKQRSSSLRQNTYLPPFITIHNDSAYSSAASSPLELQRPNAPTPTTSASTRFSSPADSLTSYDSFISSLTGTPSAPCSSRPPRPRTFTYPFRPLDDDALLLQQQQHDDFDSAHTHRHVLRRKLSPRIETLRSLRLKELETGLGYHHFDDSPSAKRRCLDGRRRTIGHSK
jgi:hypothetical protein